MTQLTLGFANIAIDSAPPAAGREVDGDVVVLDDELAVRDARGGVDTFDADEATVPAPGPDDPPAVGVLSLPVAALMVSAISTRTSATAPSRMSRRRQ